MGLLLLGYSIYKYVVPQSSNKIILSHSMISVWANSSIWRWMRTCPPLDSSFTTVKSNNCKSGDIYRINTWWEMENEYIRLQIVPVHESCSKRLCSYSQWPIQCICAWAHWSHHEACILLWGHKNALLSVSSTKITAIWNTYGEEYKSSGTRQLTCPRPRHNKIRLFCHEAIFYHRSWRL